MRPHPAPALTPLGDAFRLWREALKNSADVAIMCAPSMR